MKIAVAIQLHTSFGSTGSTQSLGLVLVANHLAYIENVAAWSIASPERYCPLV